MNLDRMLIAALVIGLIGRRAGQRPDERSWLLPLGLLACVAFTQGGLYWNIFGRGHGYFTANRLSAWALLLTLLLAPTAVTARR